MEFTIDVSIIRILIAVSMLVVGSVIDIRKREIHDFYWIVFGGVGAVLIVFEPNIMHALTRTGFALIIAPFVLLMWRLGLFGGADAFALITLAVIAPQSTLSENIITPFTTLSNALVLIIIPLSINVVRNTIATLRKEKIFDGFQESMGKKIAAILIGYRSKAPKYGFTIEKTVNGVKKINLAFHHAENEEFENKPNTWITPGLPYLLLIAGGYILQLAYGDIIFNQFGI